MILHALHGGNMFLLAEGIECMQLREKPLNNCSLVWLNCEEERSTHFFS